MRHDKNTIPGPFSHSEYEKFKRLVKIDIPDFELDEKYIEYLKENNGGKPLLNRFPIDETVSLSVDVFLNYANPGDLDSTNYHHHILEFFDNVEGRTSIYIIPFAIASGGNLLCFDYRTGAFPPPVVLFYMENSDTKIVSKSFSDFIEMLTE